VPDSEAWHCQLVLMGLFTGQILFAKINQRFFRLFTYIILLFTGLYLLAASLK
jgi:uncharacterized membrane protein YfcA